MYFYLINSTGEIGQTEIEEEYLKYINGVMDNKEWIGIRSVKKYDLATIKELSEEEFKDQYYAKRPNVILEKVGVALFGKSWKKALADALSEIKSVDERRITHWLQCTRPVPKGVWNDLKLIADQRKLEVENAIDLLTLSVEELTKKESKKALR